MGEGENTQILTIRFANVMPTEESINDQTRAEFGLTGSSIHFTDRKDLLAALRAEGGKGIRGLVFSETKSYSTVESFLSICEMVNRKQL